MLLIKTGLNGRACQVRWPSARARVFVATQYWSLIFLPSYENICKLFGRCVHVYRRCFLIFMTTKSHVRRSWCLRGSRWHQYLHQYLRPSLTLTRYPGKRDQGIRESDALLYYFAARRWEIKNNWKNTQTNFWDYINLFHWSYKEFFFSLFWEIWPRVKTKWHPCLSGTYSRIFCFESRHGKPMPRKCF